MIISRRAIALAVALTLALPVAARSDDITVFAASSLKTALDAIAADWEKQTADTVTLAYDSSAKLARQIEQGAPADLFISASGQWMDALQAGGLIRVDSRMTLLGNSLVLVAADKAAAPVTLTPGVDLAGLVGDSKLAMGLVDSVPAGQYGKQALVHLGIWDTVQPKVAQADNVRAALKLVETGEAAFGIVYASDALGNDLVAVVGTFPDDSHQPILYPAALTTASTAPGAQGFLDHLSSDAARAVFVAQGFAVPN